MTAVKEKILGAVTVMSDADAKEFWKIILDKYSPVTWEDIEEEEPDAIDLQMLKAIEEDPECHEFIKEIGIKTKTAQCWNDMIHPKMIPTNKNIVSSSETACKHLMRWLLFLYTFLRRTIFMAEGVRIPFSYILLK